MTLVTFSTLFLFAEPALTANGPNEDMEGVYVGEAFNGGDLDEVITTFKFDYSGRLTGEYSVDEETGPYRGRLSNFSFEGPREITMEWTDKFGEGFARMEFSADYQSFTGEWTDNKGSNPLPWSGKKRL
ncbi:MAG: hypothetical protein V4603_00495 [Pseudomonadota bacterium]